MIKDTFFYMPRFVNLCRKNMVESWKTNVLRFVMMYGVIVIILIWNAHLTYVNNTQLANDNSVWQFAMIFFVWTLIGFGCLSASFTMERMKTKISRLSELMTPATSFEKYFSHWVISTVVFLVVFLIAFRLADYTRVLVYSLVYPEMNAISPFPFAHLVSTGNGYYTLFHSVKELNAFIAFYFFFQSSFVLGTSIWPKNAFIKTFAAGVVIVVKYILLVVILTNLMKNGNTYYWLDSVLSQDRMLSIVCIGCWCLALFNWVLAYFRFKESEIINRM